MLGYGRMEKQEVLGPGPAKGDYSILDSRLKIL
jgi:hypothetical protein